VVLGITPGPNILQNHLRCCAVDRCQPQYHRSSLFVVFRIAYGPLQNHPAETFDSIHLHLARRIQSSMKSLIKFRSLWGWLVDLEVVDTTLSRLLHGRETYSSD
jgi:hypothetical protein